MTDETDDILDEPEGEGEGLVVALSRRVGGLARSASDRLRNVSAAFAARPEAEPSGEPGGAAGQQLAADLQELGALMDSHRSRGYATLEHDESFWRLIMRLTAARPRKRIKRVPPGGEAVTKLRKRGRVMKRAVIEALPAAALAASPPAAAPAASSPLPAAPPTAPADKDKAGEPAAAPAPPAEPAKPRNDKPE